ncbi:hypothetical protein B0H16DRAFT_1469668 [Mycena metata]|uniref:Uncharacterized protein n=1 Tax=Mycena metata TaxID=1033252 RepID=A0AAD7MSP5_9AGAR|nr:hypothetical protein B0H16DRAFT_1469668 [Mycena metata]
MECGGAMRLSHGEPERPEGERGLGTGGPCSTEVSRSDAGVLPEWCRSITGMVQVSPLYVPCPQGTEGQERIPEFGATTGSQEGLTDGGEAEGSKLDDVEVGMECGGEVKKDYEWKGWGWNLKREVQTNPERRRRD